MAEAVARAPRELSGLRVLALETAAGDETRVAPAVDVDALARARRPVTAVVRIDGSRPIAGLSLASVWTRVDDWRAAGVEVVGVEIDHDCATAALGEYARWLARARPAAPLRWSITALPAWVESPDVPRVAAAVDELVVQVHAVRAPAVFDGRRARAWLERVARAVPGRPLRVALPTYRADVGGVRRAASPREVAAFVRGLERAPIAGVRGVVWFRLPVGGDRHAWTATTLRAVIAGAPLAPAVRAKLVARGPRRYDVVVENRGAVDARSPQLRLRGEVAAADMVAGYARLPGETWRWARRGRSLRAGARVVVGWVTGDGVAVDAL